jgi:DNA-directed RNA polymerase specialized sigma24 family protein
MVSSRESAALEVLGSAATLYTNPGLSTGQAHFVRRTVSRLPEGLRKVVIMRFVGGLSASQIARQLGKRHGTVRVALHRAYKTLRKDLASLLEEIEQ